MSFVAAAEQTYTGTVQNNGFFPDLDMTEFMTDYRFDTRLPESAVRNALESSMIMVNGELADWREHEFECNGSETLADVHTTERLGDQSIYTVLYKCAVFNRGKGALLMVFADYSTTGAMGQRGKGEDRVDEKEEHATHYFAESLRAIRRIKGKPGTRVKLIKGNMQGQPGHFYNVN